ncbi:hypothetical protein [Glaciecola sp. 1036]|uniref:hypothetical protein n=1 Tax=Alteromonadaceae TaxID=72275 RepID=UPI003D0250B3
MKKVVVIVWLIFVCSCSATQPQMQNKLPELELAKGFVVNDCNGYNLARAAFKLPDTYQSQILAQDYLACSLTPNIRFQQDIASQVLTTIFNSSKPTDLPLSINPQLTRSNVFANSGFELDGNQLQFQAKAQRIEIIYKGQITPIKHLLWVKDRIDAGNYVAFYPVWGILQNDGRISFSPVYASGY